MTTPPPPAEARAIALADVIKSERPEHMYNIKPDCRCRDCLLWDAEQLLRELAAGRGAADGTPDQPDVPEMTGAWWLCPNTPPCPHGAVLHDIYDLDDQSPTCCADGCTCGGVMSDRAVPPVPAGQHPPPQRPCRYCFAAYPEIAAEICDDDYHRDTQPLYDLATAMARVFQGQRQPTDEQVGWFVDDAEAVIDDFDPLPPKWRIRRLPETRYEEFDARFRLNDVTYVCPAGGKDGKGMPVRLSTYRGWQKEADEDARRGAFPMIPQEQIDTEVADDVRRLKDAL